MSGPDEFNRLLADVARNMQEQTGTAETLDQAVAAALDIVAGCDLAGISVVYPDRIETPVATDQAVRRAEHMQYALEQGPCRAAMREHETIHSPDVAHDERWPEWGRRIADELGVHSALGFRLFATSDTLGALDLYSYTVRGFDTDDITHGLALAAHVAVALADAQRAEHLERAIVNRTVIGQAEGILMERFNLSAGDAFAVLKRVSTESNTKLSKIAEQLVTTRRTPQ